MTTPKPVPGPCPICGRSMEAAYKPFCSKRCADVDLQRWLSGAYVIPGDSDEEGEAGPPPQEDEG